jgi:hypothetical protein
MARAWITILVLVLTSGSVRAGAEVKVTSDEPASVELDGEAVGEAPLTLRLTRPGDHELRIVSARSGEARVVPVRVPRRASVARTVHASFAARERSERPSARERSARERSARERSERPSPDADHGRPAPEAASTASASASATASDPPEPPASGGRRKNHHVRRRNIALGVTALGAVTRSGLVTGLGLGGLVMNEAAGDRHRPEPRGR